LLDGKIDDVATALRKPGNCEWDSGMMGKMSAYGT